MSDYRPPLRDIRFVLTHIADLDSLAAGGNYAVDDPDLVFGALDEAGRLAAEVIAPTNRAGDTEGAVFDEDAGMYRVDFEKMGPAVDSLSEKILTLQGDGNYEEVAKLVEDKANIGEELQADLDRLEQAGIPVDIVFNQGVEVLGL